MIPAPPNHFTRVKLCRASQGPARTASNHEPHRLLRKVRGWSLRVQVRALMRLIDYTTYELCSESVRLFVHVVG